MKVKKHKITVHDCEGIRIRELNPDYFQVDYMRDRKRERHGFKTLPEAEEHCRKVANKLRVEGTSVGSSRPSNSTRTLPPPHVGCRRLS